MSKSFRDRERNLVRQRELYKYFGLDHKGRGSPPERYLNEKGEIICGAWRFGGMEHAHERGLTLQEILNDPKLKKEYFCHKYPPADTNRPKCALHGGYGGVSQKYKEAVIKAGKDDAEVLRRDEHRDLNEELSILSHFIKEELPKALTDTASANYNFLKKTLDELEKAILSLKIERVKACLAKMKEFLENAHSSREAKREVRELLKDYNELFKTEMQRRALSGEYIAKKEVLIRHQAFFAITQKYIPDDNARESCRQELITAIGEFDRPSLPAETTTSSVSDTIGLENTNERSKSRFIFSE